MTWTPGAAGMTKYTKEDLGVLEENLLELELRYGVEGPWPGAEAQLRVERDLLEKVRAELAEGDVE